MSKASNIHLNSKATSECLIHGTRISINKTGDDLFFDFTKKYEGTVETYTWNVGKISRYKLAMNESEATSYGMKRGYRYELIPTTKKGRYKAVLDSRIRDGERRKLSYPAIIVSN